MDLPIFLLFLFIILAQWSLIVLLVWRKKDQTSPTITLTEPQSLGILHRAYKKAQDIIGQAELSSVKIHAQSELDTKKIDDQLTAEIQKKLDEYMTTMTNEGKEHVQKFLEEFEKKSSESVNQSIEDYKKVRMKAVEDNISTVVTRTMELVLTKKITPEVQIDLIYEALEQAKEEKLIS